jgi:hypothetical protein
MSDFIEDYCSGDLCSMPLWDRDGPTAWADPLKEEVEKF